MKLTKLVKQLENAGLNLQLCDGLTCDEIKSLEKSVGSSFDDATRQTYSLCGGQEPGGIALFGCFRLLPPAEILRTVEDMKIYPPSDKEDPDGNPRLKRDRFWRPGWLFLAKDVHGIYLVVDFDPRHPSYAGHVFLWNAETPFDTTVANSVEHLVDLSLDWDRETNNYFKAIPLASA